MSRVSMFLIGALLSEAIAFYFVASGLRRRGRSLEKIGFGIEARPSAYFWAVVIAAAYSGMAIWTNPLVAHWAFNISCLKLLALATACVAGLFEETFFRGYLMTRLRDAGRGPTLQVIVSGLVFGLAHGVWGLGRPTAILAFVAPILGTTLLGTALASVYLLGGRKLGPVILSHALIDMVIEPGLLIATVGVS